MATPSKAAVTSDGGGGGGARPPEGELELASRILYDMEHPEQIDARKPPIPSRNRLAAVETEKRSTWVLRQRKQLARSRSSPTEFGATVAATSSSAAGAGGGLVEGTLQSSTAGEEWATRTSRGATFSSGLASSRQPVGTELELHRRGFGVARRPDIRRLVGMNLDSQCGPGQYDTNDVGAMLWQSGDVSNPPQRHISQFKTPPRCSFGKPQLTVGPKKPAISQSPGPGHYHQVDYWDPQWQRYPAAGKSFVRQPPVPGESRFGGLARGLMSGSKGEIAFLGH